jgi:hypothetical protein
MASIRFVEDKTPAIETVAERLMERKKLVGDELAMIEVGLRPKSTAVPIDDTKAQVDHALKVGVPAQLHHRAAVHHQ